MSIKACELSKWREQNYIQALAAAYAETGDFEQSCEISNASNEDRNAPIARLTKKRANASGFYQEHKPWRAEPLVSRWNAAARFAPSTGSLIL